MAAVVANAMKDWAVEKGATHFTHWFQPMTGVTAESTTASSPPVGDGKVIMEFSGKELVVGETDASPSPAAACAPSLKRAATPRGIRPRSPSSRTGRFASRPYSSHTAARCWTKRRRCSKVCAPSTARRSASSACSGICPSSACIPPSARSRSTSSSTARCTTRARTSSFPAAPCSAPSRRRGRSSRIITSARSSRGWSRSCRILIQSCGSSGSSPRPATTKSRPASTNWLPSSPSPTSRPTRTS